MAHRHQQRSFLKGVVSLAVLIALLLFLVPHAASHPGAALACFLLVPVFLFGRLDIPLSLWPITQIETILPRAPVASSLFQRPPPLLFA
jgi:hypothetical protein